MADFTWVPSYSSGCKPKVRLKKTQFGDGYTQRAVDGINALQRDWDLLFGALTDAEADAIEAFLESKMAQAFTWTPPFTLPNPQTDPITVAPTFKYVCDTWKRDYSGPNVNSISLSFEQVFE